MDGVVLSFMDALSGCGDSECRCSKLGSPLLFHLSSFESSTAHPSAAQFSRDAPRSSGVVLKVAHLDRISRYSNADDTGVI